MTKNPISKKFNNSPSIFLSSLWATLLTILLFFSGQTTILVSKLHGKLLVLEAGDETRERALMAVRLLASHNAMTVIDSLLNDHPLPFDEALVSGIINSKSKIFCKKCYFSLFIP